MNTHSRIIGLTYVALLSLPVRADTLSLATALDEVLRAPQVERAESKAEQASWQRLGAYSGFLPTISASATYLTQTKYMLTDIVFGGNAVSVPQILPNANLTLTGTLPLFDGFASTQKLRSAKAGERAADLEAEWVRFQSTREITLQFYQALSAQALKDVATQNLATLTDHLKDVQLSKRAGVATNYDVLRVEVQVSEAKSELMNADDNVYLSRGRLNELLGHPGDDRALSGTLPVLDAQVIDLSRLRALAERSDLHAGSERVRAAELSESAARRYWVPRLVAFGQYQLYNNRTTGAFDHAAYRDAYEVGLGLSWNIFDGLASMSQAKAAAETRIQGEKTLRIAELKAGQDLEFWKRKFAYFCTVYKSREGDVQKADESVRLANEGRRAGTRTNTDLLDAEAELFKARAGVVNAQIGSIQALVNLELASGQKLYEFH